MPITQQITSSLPSLQLLSYNALQRLYESQPSQLGNDLFSKKLPLGLANELIQDLLYVYLKISANLQTDKIMEQQQHLKELKIKANHAFHNISQFYASGCLWDFSPKCRVGLNPTEIKKATKTNKMQYEYIKEAKEEAEDKLSDSYHHTIVLIDGQRKRLANIIKIFNPEQLIDLSILGNSTDSHHEIAKNLVEQFKQLRRDQENLEKLYQEQFTAYSQFKRPTRIWLGRTDSGIPY